MPKWTQYTPSYGPAPWGRSVAGSNFICLGLYPLRNRSTSVNSDTKKSHEQHEFISCYREELTSLDEIILLLIFSTYSPDNSGKHVPVDATPTWWNEMDCSIRRQNRKKFPNGRLDNHARWGIKSLKINNYIVQWQCSTMYRCTCTAEKGNGPFDLRALPPPKFGHWGL